MQRKEYECEIYTGKVLWTVWELDVEDYEILFVFNYDCTTGNHFWEMQIILNLN